MMFTIFIYAIYMWYTITYSPVLREKSRLELFWVFASLCNVVGEGNSNVTFLA